MWRACLAALAAFLITPAAAQVSPQPQGQFQATPSNTTGYLSLRTIVPSDITPALVSGIPSGSVANLNGGAAVNNTIPGLLLNKTASGQIAYVAGETAGIQRWTLILGNATAESGSNAGSDFQLDAVTDAGADSGAVLSCVRSTSVCTMNTLGVTNSLTNNNIISTELPSLSASVEGSNIAGHDFSNCTSAATCGIFIFQKPTTTAGALNSPLYVQRNTLLLSGGTGSTVPAAATLLDYAGRGDISWNTTLVSVLHNQSLGSNGTQNTAGEHFATKENSTGGGEVGPTWGYNSYCWDQQPTVNPVYGCLGAEIDAYVNSGASTDTSGNRVALQLVGGVPNATDSSAHIGDGLRFATIGTSIIDKAIDFYGPATIGTLVGNRNGTITATKGIDFSTGFTFSGNIFSTANWVMDLNSNQTTTSGAPAFSLNAAAAGEGRTINGLTNAVLRWQFQVGNATAEGGSNAGSDFVLNAFSDAGGFLSTPITVKRSTGLTTLTTALMGGATSSLISFYGTAGVAQRAAGNNAAVPAGGVGTAGGGWDTAAHRDTAIATINEIRTTLINLGLMPAT